MIDFINHWHTRTGWSVLILVGWIGISRSKYFDWRSRFGKANEHNGWIPRDHWLADWEQTAIVRFAETNPLCLFGSLA